MSDVPKTEECPLCHERVFSRAMHLMFCPKVNEDLSADELKRDENQMATLLNNVQEPMQRAHRITKRRS